MELSFKEARLVVQMVEEVIVVHLHVSYLNSQLKLITSDPTQ